MVRWGLLGYILIVCEHLLRYFNAQDSDVAVVEVSTTADTALEIYAFIHLFVDLNGRQLLGD